MVIQSDCGYSSTWVVLQSTSEQGKARDIFTVCVELNMPLLSRPVAKNLSDVV